MKRKLVMFSLFAWLCGLGCIAICIWFMHRGINTESPFDIIGGLAGILIGIGVLHFAGGYIIIFDDRIYVRQKLFHKAFVVYKDEIKSICISTIKFDYRKRDYSRTNFLFANNKKGPIIGAGFMTLRVLIKDLGVPINLHEVPVNLLPNVKLLLQKGQLTRVKAERLKEKFHIPQKLFDKWYVEPKQ